MPFCLGRGDGGQQHDGKGIGYGGGKEDEGQGNACQDAVDSQGIRRGESELFQGGGDEYGLHAVKQGQHQFCAGEGDEEEEEAGEYRGGGRSV